MLEFFFNIQNTQGKELVHVVLEAEKSHSLVSAGWRAREAGSIVWRPGIQEFYGLTTRPSLKTDKTCMLETRDNRYAIFNSLAGSKLNLPFLLVSYSRSMEWVTLTRQSWEGFSDLFGLQIQLLLFWNLQKTFFNKISGHPVSLSSLHIDVARFIVS